MSKKKNTEEVMVADVIVKTLKKHGTEYIFGVPGEEIEELLFAIEREQMVFVPTRHEQGAAFMADVWGRITGRAGVAISTLGPGATNLITGIADAFLDRSPVITITGQAGTERLHKESHQMIDMVSMLKPIVKWNTSLQNPKIAEEVMLKAFKVSESQKPGPVHIDLPEDVASMSADYKEFVLENKEKKEASISSINKAGEILKEAKKPIIFAGNGVIRDNASGIIKEFSEEFNIPVVTTFMGKGIVSNKSELSLFTVGLKALDFPTLALIEADVVICVGYDIAEYDPSFWNIGKRNLIHIDSQESEVYESYMPKVELVGDVSSSVSNLSRVMFEKMIKPFSKWYEGDREKMRKDLDSYKKTPKKNSIPFVLSKLRKVMNDDDILISDVGSHKMWIARNFECFEPNTCIISNGLASMGIALPGAISLKLAKPDKNIVAVMGDGGFLMNAQEIETAKRIGTAFVIVVLNDNDYGLITWKQNNHRGKSFGTKLTNPDFSKFAESFGIKSYKVKSPANVESVLKTAINSKKLCLVEIDIDPSVNIELSKKLNNLKK